MIASVTMGIIIGCTLVSSAVVGSPAAASDFLDGTFWYHHAGRLQVSGAIFGDPFAILIHRHPGCARPGFDIRQRPEGKSWARWPLPTAFLGVRP